MTPKKLYCDASGCTVSKDIEKHPKDTFFFCRFCSSCYLCRYHLKRKRGIQRRYLCPVCGSTLTELPIYRAEEIGLVEKVVPRFAQGTTYRNVFKKIDTRSEKPPLQQIIDDWEIILDYDERDEALVTAIEKQVKELSQLDNLSVTIIFSLLGTTELDLSNIDMNTDDLYTALKNLSDNYPEVVNIMYRVLIEKEVFNYFGKTLTLMMKAKELFDASFITADVRDDLKGTIDLYSVNEDTGKISWYVILDEPLNEQIYSTLITQILSIKPISFAKLERVVIVSNQFTWTVKKIIERQSSITVSTGKAQIQLCRLENDGTVKLIDKP